MKTILFKYTSRSRPENFLRGLLSIIDNTNHLNHIAILVSLDKDDTRLNDYYTVIEPHYGKCFIKVITGTSTNKINAINRDLNEYKGDWDILVNMSDDMVFTVKGFDDVIREQFAIHFPNGDGFLHLSDGFQGQNISTMSIMDKAYYNRDRYIYHPSYQSLWCDKEATEVAIIRGCYHYGGDDLLIFKHLHPAWGVAPMDEQYIRTEAFNSTDKQIYLNRKANGFTTQTVDSDSHVA